MLTEKDGKLFGRGSSDDKGPVLCWLHAIEAYQAIGKYTEGTRNIICICYVQLLLVCNCEH